MVSHFLLTMVLYLDNGRRAARQDDDSLRKSLDHDGKISRARHASVTCRGSALVELTKKDGCSLGLVVSGGIDKDDRPRVSYLRPGGIAHRSDVLQVGDYILAINAIRTVMLRHEEIINLLKNAGQKLLLEIEYELPDSPQSTFSVLCKRVEVRLEREGDTFGFVLRGGAHNDCEKARPLTVTFIRPGSAADREGTLKVGDRVLAINRVNVTQLSLTESSRILRHADLCVTLLVEYDVSVMEAVQNACTPLLVEIDKAAGTCLGITLASRVLKAQRQILISNIQPASIADRCGALHVGDQILSIDETSLDHVSVSEATQLLRGCHSNQIRLEIIPVTSAARHKPGLGETPSREYFGRQRAGMYNNVTGSIQSMASYTSLTTQVGSAVDGATVQPPVPTAKTNGIPPGQHVTKHPGSNAGTHQGSNMGTHPGAGVGTHPGAGVGKHTTGSGYGTLQTGTEFKGHSNTLKATASNWVRGELRHSTKAASVEVLDNGTSTLPHSLNTLTLQSTNQVCHTDSTEVIITPCDKTLQTGLDPDRIGYQYGILLQDGAPDDILLESPIITHVQPNTPAERTGILQEGDRVLSVNGTLLRNRTYSDVASLLSLKSGVGAGPGGGGSHPLTLMVEFDVADSIVPSSGVFNVKLFKRGAGLGITISSSANRKDTDPLIISNVKKGSVAHRTGTIQPGDKLLAIDRVQMDNCTIEDAAQVLQNTGDIVKLKIKKDEIFAEECNNACVTYTVELQKQNGPLGITISGTEEPFDPIIISGLSDGGLAQKTGALHMGDRILAINSVSLRGRPLSDAIQMLQEAGDAVTFRITRPNLKTTDAQKSSEYDEDGVKISTPLQSVDSALESWDSSGLESNQAKSNTTTTTTTTNTTSITGNSSASSHEAPAQLVKSGTYNDLNQELHLVTAPGVYDDGPVSCASSAGGEQDAWSRALDCLDAITTPDMVHHSETASLASQADGIVDAPTNLSPLSDLPDMDAASNESYTTSTKIGADLHIKEVEEQLQNIFTPTPVQLHKVCLVRENELEDFGFGLSDGVYEKGVYISAIRHGGPAERTGLLRAFDRVLQVNEQKTKDLECHQIVPTIADSGLSLELVISRNPIASQLMYRGNIPLGLSQQSVGAPLGLSQQSMGPSSSRVSSRVSSDCQSGGVPSTALNVDDDGELISVNVLLENLDVESTKSDETDSDIWQPRSTTATVIRAPARVRIDDKLRVETV